MKRGVLTRVDKPKEVVAFAFNPQTLQVRKASTWRANPTPNNPKAPPPQFIGTTQRTVTMQVLFDAWSSPEPSVGDRVDRLLSWTCPTKATVHTDRPQPPLVRLDWGGLPGDLTCYLRDVTATYLLFDEQGEPTRATVDLVLEETPSSARAQNPTSGGEPGTRARTLVQGDTLASVAQAEYGDAGLWRALADANGIDDPMRAPVGQRLLVPPRARARATSAPPGDDRG